MASIDSLLIQGIRSFSPDKPAIITFHPITLILGPNGAGKTTIIECLRYITSNEVPPNSNRGKTFIHDPTLIKKNVSCVRAKIQLKFNDIYKKKPVATKNLELSVSRDKLGKIKTSIRTVDFAIKFDDQTRVSTKCAEIDSLMLDHLGVSKAILTNVIFCHQEDSNWPLSEGKVLKDKFDQIFGSTEYVKALKKLKDIRKEHLKNIELLKKDEKYLDEILNQYKKLNLSIKKKETNLITIENSIKEIKNELKPIEEKLNKINLNEQELSEISSNLDKLQGHINAESRAYTSLKEKIIDIFDGNLQELKEQIEQHKERMNLKSQSKIKLDEDLQNLENKLNELIDELHEERISKNKMEINKDEYVLCENQLNEFFSELNNSKIYSENLKSFIQKNCSNLNADYILKIKQLLNFEIKNIKNELNDKKTEINFKIDSIQKEINENKNKEFKTNQIIKVNQEQINKLIQEIDNHELQLSKVKLTETKMRQLDDDLQEYTKKLNKEIELYDLSKIEKEIKILQDSINQNYTEITNLNNLSFETQKYETLKKKMKETEIDVHDKNVKLNIFYQSIKKVISNLNLDNENNKIFPILKKEIQTLNLEITKLTENIQKKKTSLNGIQKDMDYEQNKISELKFNIDEINENIFKLDDNSNFKHTLSECVKTQEKLEEEITLASNSEYLLKSQIKEMKNSQNCPLCEQKMSPNNKQKIIKKIEFKITSLPNQTDLLKKNKIEQDVFYQKLLRYETDQKQLNSYEFELKSKENNYQKLIQDKLKLTNELNQLNDNLNCLKKKYHDLEDEEENILKYDECLKFIEEKNQFKNKLLIELDRKPSFESLDDLNLQIVNYNDEIQENQNKIKNLERKKTIYSQKISLSKEKIIEIKQIKLDYENQHKQAYMDLQNVAKKKEKMQELLASNEGETKNLELYQDLDQSILKKKNLFYEEKTKFNEYYERKIKKMEKDFYYLEELNQKYLTLQAKYNQGKYDQYNENINKIEFEITNLRSIKIDKDKKRTKLIDFLDKARIETRDLDDNLTLLETKNKLKELNQTLADQQTKLGAVNRTSLLKLKDEYERKSANFNMKIHTLTNDLVSIEQSINEDKIELKADKFKDIKIKCQKLLVELIVKKVVCEDLNKYYVALEKSVLTYHGTKMKEINQLINRFWKKTYRGQDIDTIKIVSEEEISNLDKRRSYNYRVVMIKSGNEMDMRGRCSAGQRVLASLVIRLALAEIFCISCGILALDEPTTNLDKESVYAFANSLKELVEEHRKYKNFQIIIITHDEEFLKCLDNENDEYYMVIQDENGNSIIKKYKIYDRD